MPVGREYREVKLGTTPDGGWTWYMICTYPGGEEYPHILGIVAESPERKRYSNPDERFREYRVFMHEQGYNGGTVSYTSVRSLDEAIVILRARYIPGWTGDQ